MEFQADAETLFLLTMDLMGERNEISLSKDSAAYKAKFLSALNSVLSDLFYAEKIMNPERKELSIVDDMNSNVPLCKELFYSAAPSGIAALLLAGADDDRFSAYRALYEAGIASSLKNIKAKASEIVNYY